MSEVILDASALLALINREKGSEVVERHLYNVAMSTVNLSEVAGILVRHGMSITKAKTILDTLIVCQIAFDSTQAYLAAALQKTAKTYGLSFGDRACLSLAQSRDLPVLTADRVWKKLKIGVEIKLIRN